MKTKIILSLIFLTVFLFSADTKQYHISLSSQTIYLFLFFNLIILSIIVFILKKGFEKKMELRKNEFDTILNDIPDLLWIKNKNGVFLECNKRFEEFFGAKKEEIIGKTDFDFVDKELAEFFTEHDKNAMESDVPLSNFEKVVFKNDGHEEYLKTTKTKVLNNSGKIIGVLGIGRDFTAEKKLQEEISFEKQKYKYLLENSSDAIFIVDLGGNLIEYSKLFKKVLGYEDKELLTFKVTDFEAIHEEEVILENINKTSFEPISFESKYKRKDGTLFDVFVSIVRIKVFDEELVYCSMRDISAQKEYENRLVQQKEEFETIFNYSRDAILVIDKKLDIFNFNKEFITIFAFDEKNSFKMNFLDLLVEEYKDKLLNGIKIALEKGFIENQEANCISFDKKLIPINYSISLLPDKQRFLIFIKDTTSLKIVEQQTKLASMGEMIGNIAHQWRQPLSAITTNVSGLSLKVDMEMPISNEEILHCSEEVMKQANYLSTTIDNFRNFIKDEKGTSLVSIKNVIENSISLVQSSLNSSYIKLITKIDEDISIVASKNELSEAFINILNNAKDALKELVENEEDRYIFIEVKRIDRNSLVLRIYDSAGGIDSSIKDRIFEPYFTTKYKSQGTGLGLVMVDKILRERHNFKLDVYNKKFTYNNKEYVGACFEVIITY
jgi:PAS domain S-box-containing protein